MNLALGLKRLPGLFLADTLAVIIAAVLLAAGVAGIDVGFLHGLNFLFDVATASADLFDSLPEKLLLIFFPLFLDQTRCIEESLEAIVLESQQWS